MSLASPAALSLLRILNHHNHKLVRGNNPASSDGDLTGRTPSSQQENIENNNLSSIGWPARTNAFSSTQGNLGVTEGEILEDTDSISLRRLNKNGKDIQFVSFSEYRIYEPEEESAFSKLSSFLDELKKNLKALEENTTLAKALFPLKKIVLSLSSLSAPNHSTETNEPSHAETSRERFTTPSLNWSCLIGEVILVAATITAAQVLGAPISILVASVLIPILVAKLGHDLMFSSKQPAPMVSMTV